MSDLDDKDFAIRAPYIQKILDLEADLAEVKKDRDHYRQKCDLLSQAGFEREECAERAELKALTAQGLSSRMFRMSGGPDIPWEMGRALFAGYTAFNGLCYKTVEELHERGGLGWAEVELMWTEKRRGERFKEAFNATIRGEEGK